MTEEIKMFGDRFRGIVICECSFFVCSLFNTVRNCQTVPQELKVLLHSFLLSGTFFNFDLALITHTYTFVAFVSLKRFQRP